MREWGENWGPSQAGRGCSRAGDGIEPFEVENILFGQLRTGKSVLLQRPRNALKGSLVGRLCDHVGMLGNLTMWLGDSFGHEQH